MTALQISLNIDNDYLSWAQQQQNTDCGTGFNSSYYNEATSEDSQATNDKQAFVDSWDSVAGQYGLTQFQAAQI